VPFNAARMLFAPACTAARMPLILDVVSARKYTSALVTPAFGGMVTIIDAGLTWIVERSFAWLGRNRRLSKDYEYRMQRRN
jgi:hypothetical protein